MMEEIDVPLAISGFNFIRVSFIKHVPEHKDAQGKSAPWVIVSHETGKIIASFPSESAAREQLQRMHFFKSKGSLL